MTILPNKHTPSLALSHTHAVTTVLSLQITVLLLIITPFIHLHNAAECSRAQSNVITSPRFEAFFETFKQSISVSHTPESVGGGGICNRGLKCREESEEMEREVRMQEERERETREREMRGGMGLLMNKGER